jgi:8-oxo-dGTP diphosphatase
MDLAGRRLFAVATDLVVLAISENALRLLLVRRGTEPFAGQWALPGGFVEDGESLDDCARRELQEETGVELRRLDQLAAFSAPDRDPRGDVISVAYLALVRANGKALVASSDAAEANWRDIDALPKLAFDHDEVVRAARQRLAQALYTTTVAFDLLPDDFTLAEAQIAFERVRGMPIDKRNFRSWLQKGGLLRQSGGQRRGQHRPAELYRFERKGQALRS